MIVKKGDCKLYITKVLDAMYDYFKKEQHNFYKMLLVGYCNNCSSIVPIGGDYTIFSGSDCYGEHYKTISSPEQCIRCNSRNFNKISKYDFSGLKKIYGEKTQEVLIKGIVRGLKHTNFPSIYNENLPQIIKHWNHFSRKSKINQINSLIALQEKIKKEKKHTEKLEKMLVGR